MKSDWISLIFFIEVLTVITIILQTETFYCKNAICTSAHHSGKLMSPKGQNLSFLRVRGTHRGTQQPGSVDASSGQGIQPLLFLIFLLCMMGIQSLCTPTMLWVLVDVFNKCLWTILHDNIKLSFLFLQVIGVEPRTPCMWGKCSSTELQPQPLKLF